MAHTPVHHERSLVELKLQPLLLGFSICVFLFPLKFYNSSNRFLRHVFLSVGQLVLNPCVDWQSSTVVRPTWISGVKKPLLQWIRRTRWTSSQQREDKRSSDATANHGLTWTAVNHIITWYTTFTVMWGRWKNRGNYSAENRLFGWFGSVTSTVGS